MVIVSATDPGMPVVYVNRAFEQVTGYSRAEVIGGNFRFLQGDDHDQPELDKIRRAILEQCDGQAVLRNYRKDGSLFWNKLYITPVRDPRSNRVTHFVGVQYDITEIKGYQEELEHQANHDALTGLANRNLLKDRLRQALALAHRYKRPFSLTFIDLDNFKLINDSLGHDIGDRLLKIAAERLAACVQEGDTVARLGGDEFVLLVAEQEQEEGIYRAVQRVMAAHLAAVRDRSARIQDYVFGRHRELSARWRGRRHAAAQRRHGDVPGQGSRPQQLPALFVRHECGPGRAPYAGDRSVEGRRAQRAAFFTISRRSSSSPGASSAWKPCFAGTIRPRGMIPPGKFIPVAEASSLITEIGTWVINEACRNNKAWQDANLRAVPIAVNISARQLHDKDLVDTIRTALQTTRLRPEHLEIELTESAVMMHPEDAINTMARLRGMDVRIALDDFGTGYSSLSYLKRLPVTGLKIDQSFVRDLAFDPDDAAIVRAIVAVAHELMLEVTAEGVETAEQAEFLKTHGCNEAQGYYFARPVPADQMRALLERGNLPVV